MKPKKLRLRKETLRMLTDSELTQAVAGTGTSIAFIRSILDGCSGPNASWACPKEAAQPGETG
jgi:hypothetical protein